ncbi:hypothetical protein KY349_03125 [Candidatus Woesearchaeota archaeon]|jgi:uncharacterized coiled-coil DUF342 family protein|nr:hypothetical protein [Candidatus Woesearchaeota archaeon]
MNEEERKKILAEVEAKRKELDTLKAKLAELNSQKEAWFEKKRRATREISDVAKSIRDAKGKRNTFTKQVKDSKTRRQELNKLLKQKMDEMKKLQAEKQATTNKFGMRVDPSKIQQEIEQLEFKIETEALPFSVEQRVMKMISEKKKVLEQSREVSDVFEKVHQLRKELDRVRKKADDTHRKVQTKAESSQQFHEELIESSQQIGDLRKKEEEALKKFVDLKQQWTKQGDLIRAKLDDIRSLKAKLDGINLEEKKKTKKAEEKKIAEQEKSVEEKIKKGMKITTEDLLVFQAREENGKFGKGKRQNKRKPARKESKERQKS